MKDVVVYGTGEACVWCVRCCELLLEKEIEYTYKNLREDEEAMAFIRSLGLRSVPQVFVGGVNIGGYAELKEYLK